MKKTSDKDVKRWLEHNVLITLDQLSQEDGNMWLNLAEEETWRFFRLGGEALRLRRERLGLEPPVSKREIKAFLLEFRIKLQLIHDQFQGLPNVPMFDFGGDALFNSTPFNQAVMLYSGFGGAA